MVIPFRTKSWPTGHTYNEKVNALELSPASSLLSVAVRFVIFFEVVVGIAISKKNYSQHSLALSSIRNTPITNFKKSVEFNKMGSSERSETGTYYF